MISASVGEVARVVDGTLVDGARANDQVQGVTSDSRSIEAGQLFVALQGTQVDGHDFARQAIASGAAVVLASRGVGAPAIVVDDVLLALGKLARHHIEQLPGATVIAITGSVGKTTTKDLLAHVLTTIGPTVAPPGSFNNELGLPMTVLTADAATRFLVLEMGARSAGHIDYLCGIAPPKVGVELAVGSAHIGEFGGREEIAKAKAELVRALPASGIAVLNEDDDYVRSMSEQTTARAVTFGESRNADMRAENVRSDQLDRASFTLCSPDGQAVVDLRLPGRHLVPNALAAAATAWALGVPLEVVARRLGTATSVSRWRMETSERVDGLIVINDAYNASPESVRAALKSLKHIGQDRRTWAVLGEMRELGEASVAEHDSIGRLVVRLDVQRLVVVGEAARPIYLAAQHEGSWGEEAAFVPDVDAAIELLLAEVRPDDVVLLKASRAVGLERAANALLAGECQ
ncbi:MAG TPA: UDP-N-acetylmuramoyl-tripeptide--D-alanyl-D-alanine ligase [Actinomycetes bacterium]|nr:UDP-N-acetylmuramoyl-tripeptide--D-alanyl-D-alanine ligase [Actinomycetes bacterium]